MSWFYNKQTRSPPVSFDGRPTTPLTTSTMNKDYYRQVPNRFFVNQSSTDACKLEKLTNLFPDMKATIELELFKINNLSRTIDRLSRIYTILTALDIRDDTLHLFLGPYHLSLGPALFAALHFKNASSALLIASQSSTFSNSHSEGQRRKRRRDAVLRRFRRAVRKLTLVKSIIDQLQPASILTPYNQYELYTHGIYDLVLSGRIQQCTDSMFINDQFIEQLHNFDTVTNAGERSPLLASNFIKINNLLNLLSSSTPTQSTNDHSLTAAAAAASTTAATTSSERIVRIGSNESLSNPANSEALVNPSSTVCCSQHSQTPANVMYCVPRPMSPQPSQFLTIGTRSRCNSHSNLLKTPSILSRQSTANSLPDSAAGDGSNSDIPSSISLQSKPIDTEVNTPTNLIVEHPFNSTNLLLSSSPSTNEEDALINRVSSLLTDYILSRSSTTIPSNLANQFHEHETNSNLSDSAISLSTSATTSLINPLISSNQSSHSIPINDFDKLLLRIKTAVDNRLSIETNTKANRMGPTKHIHQDLSYSPIRSTATNRRQQLLALHAVSCQETHTDDYDSEQSINRKNHLNHTTKSQSFDATNLNNHDVIATTTTTASNLDTNNTTYQMSTVQSDDKGVQTDPRIRHARSKLLQTLQAYIAAVSRYRHHLFQQYTQSNTNSEQHYSNLPELQQYEYRDLINVRKEILNRFEWVINELEQIIESLEARRLTVGDAQQRIDQPLVKEVIESSLNADLPTPIDEYQTHANTNVRQRPIPSEDEWRMYARDLQDTKEDLHFINSLVHRGISKIDRLVTFSNLYT